MWALCNVGRVIVLLDFTYYFICTALKDTLASRLASNKTLNSHMCFNEDNFPVTVKRQRASV